MRPTHLIVWAVLALSASVQAQPDLSSPAAWRSQRIDFDFPARSSRYSCKGLTEKVRAMLLDLGARHDVMLVPSGCLNVQGRREGSGTPHVKILFYAPVLTKTGAPATGPTALRARFEPFTLASETFGSMGAPDCELVEAFVGQILPMLTVRNVTHDIQCSVDHPSSDRFLVRGEVLKPAEPEVAR